MPSTSIGSRKPSSPRASRPRRRPCRVAAGSSTGRPRRQPTPCSSGPGRRATAGTHGQVRLARADGLDAWGWLPASDDRETLVEYALKQPSPLVVVPETETDLAELELNEEVTPGPAKG